MDIFIIKIVSADDVHMELLKQFQKKPISNPESWNRHCLSYLMVDRILKEVYKIETREIDFVNKKPILVSKEKHFSISHSKDYIALAFSDKNCGIDIEENKQRDFEKISQRMNFNAKTLDEFYQKWTEFEAKYKLGNDFIIAKTFKIENYTITAVSENPDENFEIYIQNN